jgi:hypothetical protein
MMKSQKHVDMHSCTPLTLDCERLAHSKLQKIIIIICHGEIFLQMVIFCHLLNFLKAMKTNATAEIAAGVPLVSLTTFFFVG